MINNVILMGRMVRDPELKTTRNGTATCAFTIAVQRDKPGANGQREVDYIDCISWRKTAEFVATYFRKAGMIWVRGAIRIRTWQDKAGNNRKAYEIEVENVGFCGDYDDTDYYDHIKKRAKSAAEREFEKEHAQQEPEPVTDFSDLEETEDERDDKVPF